MENATGSEKYVPQIPWHSKMLYTVLSIMGAYYSMENNLKYEIFFKIIRSFQATASYGVIVSLPLSII